MQEKLKELKKLNEELINRKQLFKNMKSIFNYNVENEKKDIEELFIDEETDSYEAAKYFNKVYQNEIALTKAITREHPKYGKKRIKKEIIKLLFEYYQIDYQIDTRNSLYEQIADNYILYDSCGFYKVLEQENEMVHLEQLISNVKTELLDESKEAVSSIGSGAINILKPYGEVAKGQLNDAANTAKGLINKGSKKLVKFLQKIEDKTSK